MEQQKSVLVLARRDHLEAMRVAAGLTIFGHQVRLIFMSQPVTEEIGTSDQAELLELSGIEPETTVAEMSAVLPLLDSGQLAAAITEAQQVVNL
ncbi:MAG: hypothetical protein H6964_05680 [Chromatiaceae bacterium]|nr:hypothetical protein [Gammaproteobacteria bacterium]MCP5426655.1 hypothetical protein [Chromatiaceae bacterium]MCB1860539.1 hypothetical protein [Gammaproteobacteria bacterium]MCB1879300.1 hypothetical protein [Gammaproteobacteria bacterium]MCB1903916.1 hypothetical protein [Gammaproteobacteria bacterium]